MYIVYLLRRIAHQSFCALDVQFDSAGDEIELSLLVMPVYVDTLKVLHFQYLTFLV